MPIVFREEKFLTLLGKMMKHVEKLQNQPPVHVPQEGLVAQEVLEYLKPYEGIIKAEYHSFTEGRGNVILTYPGTGDRTISFVGSHMDVVPADPTQWQRNPFELIREGDRIYGRGTTDCLGHVALLTEMFAQLGEQRPALATSVVAVFICNEEDSTVPDIGVDALNSRGLISHLKSGPMYWVDSADSQPCIGTAACQPWQLVAKGRLFHSGLQHLAINAIELAQDALTAIQERFYKEFGAHPSEAAYAYPISSTLKPTAVSYPNGGLNQIPGETTLKGDIRMTPFFDIAHVKQRIEEYVQEINADIENLAGKHGPFSKYAVTVDGNVVKGHVELTWLGHPYEAIACNLESPGYHALVQATQSVLGSCKPYSITGSLPLVKELQDAGFDLQVVGYGFSAAYHANNEYADLKNLAQGCEILAGVIDRLNK